MHRCRCRPQRPRPARAEGAMEQATATDGGLRAAKPPTAAPVIRTIAMPADTNPAGDIFGGWLMAQMDLAAGNVATRRAQGRCATVAVEAIAFLSPVFVGDEVSLTPRWPQSGALPCASLSRLGGAGAKATRPGR